MGRIIRETERHRKDRTWNVKAVEMKRAAKVPTTNAAESTPERIPNADTRSVPGMMSA